MTGKRPLRLVVIGNSGAGKSSLAGHVGSVCRLPVHDLDLVHWLDDDGSKRSEDASKARVAELTAGETWAVEGVYGWLAEVALIRATMLVWLDLSWDECRDGLLARGLRRGMTARDQVALLAWAENYWTRATPSSLVGHGQLYRAFDRSKAHLRSRAEIDAFRERRWGPV